MPTEAPATSRQAIRKLDAIDGVWFWPEPMDSMMELEWLVHFRAFVLGATADKRSEL